VLFLLLGDIVGRNGRRIIREMLPSFIKERNIDFVIANGENAAGGFGLTEKVSRDLFSYQIDVLTSGNHIWDKKEIYDFIDDEERILRPANYPPETPGRGYNIYNINDTNFKVCVINLGGRVFSNINLDCPFRKADAILNSIESSTDIIIVDIHAEATSEKEAAGWYLDGRVSVVAGTHTHIQTSDDKILPGGTAYITDLGRCGAVNSILGVKKEEVLEKFISQLPARFNPAKGSAQICGLLVEVNSNGRALEAERVILKDKN